jgi:hypothetical protein
MSLTSIKNHSNEKKDSFIMAMHSGRVSTKTSSPGEK